MNLISRNFICKEQSYFPVYSSVASFQIIVKYWKYVDVVIKYNINPVLFIIYS